MNNIASKVSVITVIALIGKIMGILRDRMQGVYFGTYSVEGIAFTQASMLPRLFLDVMFASVLSASFIPVFNKILQTKGKEAAFDLAASFVKVVFIITIVFTAFTIIFADPIYGLFFYDPAVALEVRPLAVRLLRLMLPIIVISSLAFSFTGILQSLGQFNIPAAMSVASNGIILVYYLLLMERFGVYGLAVAFLIGWSSQALIQVPFLLKHRSLTGWFFEPVSANKLKDIGKLTLPVMVASWLAPVNFFVNARASLGLYGGQHGFVAINMAHTLYTVITGVVVLSLANVLFPQLAKLAADNDLKEYAGTLKSSLRGLLFVLIPMTFGLMAVAQPLVRLVFEGGRFQQDSVQITATALFYFSIGIVGFGLQVILSRACFALQDGKGPLIAAIVAIIVNAVLSFTLAPIMQIAGPALASAIAISLAGLILFIRLCKKTPQLLWDISMTLNTAKILILSMAMYLVVVFFLGVFSGVLIAIPIAVGVGVYVVGCLLLQVPEAKMVIQVALAHIK